MDVVVAVRLSSVQVHDAEQTVGRVKTLGCALSELCVLGSDVLPLQLASRLQLFVMVPLV
jgi:hypothetical protein